MSHKGPFKFCDIFHNANGAWVPAWPPDVPEAPPPSQPSGSGWWGTGQPPSPTPPPAPPGQVQLPHGIPQIAGTWRGNNGRTYHLYQFQKGFSWTIEGATEQGTGHFIGKENMQLTVSWQGQFGFGETQGKIVQMQGDQATRITWNNGLVFERQ